MDSSEQGLSAAQAADRLALHGPNQLTVAARDQWLVVLGGSLVPLLLGQSYRTLQRRKVESIR